MQAQALQPNLLSSNALYNLAVANQQAQVAGAPRIPLFGQAIPPGNPANMNAADQARVARALEQEQTMKKALTNVIQGLAGQGAGRNMPAYNQHEQAGRVGLVEPALVGQGTNLPVPFNRQWELASNLQAYINALPPEIYQQNEQIRQLVQNTVPQAQHALVYKHTIYDKVPSNFMVNRLNLALQRKREQSIYGVV